MLLLVGQCRGPQSCLGSKQLSVAVRLSNAESFASLLTQVAGAEAFLLQI